MTMSVKRCLIFVFFVWLSGFFGIANAGEAQGMVGQRLVAGPVQVHMQPGEKPVVLFSSPCMLIAKIDHGFPPTTAFREIMVNAILATNNLRPIDLQPVCM
jgi:hypothetical protein